MFSRRDGERRWSFDGDYCISSGDTYLLYLVPDPCSSTTMPPLQTRVVAHETALICQDADLKGDITIGAGSVIHPKATLFAVAGPIVLGVDCIVEENAVIVNRRKEAMRIGDENHFMAGCRVESSSIGNLNTFNPRCQVASTIRITDHCSIGAATFTTTTLANSATETLEPYTAVYGEGSQRRTWDGTGEGQERALHAKQLEYLRDVLPKFNRIRIV